MPKKSSESIDITPDPSLMEDIGSASYTLYQAINELLANTFDARCRTNNDEPLPLHVDVDITPGKSVVISDTACGMDKKTLTKALTLGYKMDRMREKDELRSRKGMYGLGMKTAAASLGQKWEIWTRSIKDNNDYYACFDLEEFKQRWKNSASELWKIQLETLDRNNLSPLGDRRSGTVIKITGMRDASPDIVVLEEHIGAAYRVEIRKFDDKIYINKQLVAVSDPSIVDGTRKEIDFELIVGEKTHRVVGWWGRLPTYNNTGKYGFDLYREGQLIQTNLKEPFFKPHNTLSNFYASLELPFIKANYHKKGFDHTSTEWKALEKKMLRDIMPEILKTVRQWKAKDLTGSQQGGGAKAGGQIAVGTAPHSPSSPTVQPKEPTIAPVEIPIEPTKPTSPGHVASGALDWRCIEFAGIKPFKLTFELIPMNSEIVPWAYIEPTEDQTLLVKINVDSTLYKKSKDSTIFAIFAVADCVCQYLHDKCKQDSKLVRKLRDQWLSRAASSSFSDIVENSLIR